ncbi:MAG: hypothetical protein HYV36_00950 [Lentisphaerae bacterium]|nr:hypothetical protein [Lentisphaerota bacterium]
MLPGLIVILSALIGLASGSTSALPQGQASAFIFIEERPAFTSADRTAQAQVIYLNDRGKVQRYACADDKITAFAESSLSVEPCFKTLAALSLKALPTAPAPADENQPPSQAGSSHTRVVLRQAPGAEYIWEGTTSLVPAELGKLLEEARKLAAQARPAAAAGVFVRADLMSAQRRDEYRSMRLLRQVQNLNDLAPVLPAALAHPFCLIRAPAGENPLAAFAVKGEPSQVQIVFQDTGYEFSRYTWRQ